MNPLFDWFFDLWLRRKQRRCHHENYDLLGEKILGVGLGLSLKPERVYEWKKACLDCGKVFTTTGTFFADKKFHPEAYGPDGWPVDPKTGAKLEIFEGYR